MTHVRVGISVILCKESRILLGLRKGSHGAGTWAFPGGHLEMGESFSQCASRELLEETGMVVPPKHMLLFTEKSVTNDIFSDLLHYVTIYMTCRWQPNYGEPRVMEPDKCEQWKYFKSLEDMPADQLFLPIKNLAKDIQRIY